MKTLHVCLLSLLLAISLAWGEESAIQVVPLQHRTVEEVLPVLRPLLDKDGALSGMNGQLIIRTTPANMQQLKAVLSSIDRAPRRLVITVSQGEQSDDGNSGASVSGTVGAGGGLRARVYSSSSASQRVSVQQVQVLEGRPALISIGQSLPLTERRVVRDGMTTRIEESTVQRDVSTGFYVLPRLVGDRVTLEISPQRESVSRSLGRGGEEVRIDAQRLQTSVSGRLGEWMEIGAAVREQSGQESGVVYRSSGQGGQQGRVRVKVEELH
jgi:type II secretory pathway component GspD/PulD (secretin)